MTITRRTFHRWAASVVTGSALTLSAAGCSLLPPGPVPLVPFGDFSLITSGGIAGIYRELRISADGTGLVLSDDPAAGRVGRATMDRLRTLLESEELRRDVARLLADRSRPRCTDTFSTTLRMGELSATRVHPCGTVPTPALDELDTIVRPFWDGDFEEPLPDGPEPPPIVIREVRGGTATEQRIVIDAGRAAAYAGDTMGEPQQLEPRPREVLRLLAAGPRCEPDWELDDGYVVLIGDQPASEVVGRRPAPGCPEWGTIVGIGLDAVAG